MVFYCLHKGLNLPSCRKVARQTSSTAYRDLPVSWLPPLERYPSGVVKPTWKGSVGSLRKYSVSGKLRRFRDCGRQTWGNFLLNAYGFEGIQPSSPDSHQSNLMAIAMEQLHTIFPSFFILKK